MFSKSIDLGKVFSDMHYGFVAGMKAMIVTIAKTQFINMKYGLVHYFRAFPSGKSKVKRTIIKAI